ncbi:hypothetical protein BH24ACT23_BH24ACT23_09950 [soil metagenome]
MSSPDDRSCGDSGSAGYSADTGGYPILDSEGVVPGSPEAWELDLECFQDPREVVRLRLFTSDQPIAHDGKAGWAVERETGKAVWIDGEPQLEVMTRSPGAPRDEPGLTDLPAHGGLPEPADTRELAAPLSDADDRRRVQIGLKLTLAQGRELDAAAEVFGVRRTTLARLLVVRGVREILRRSPD